MMRDHWVSAAEWGVIVLVIGLDAAFARATGIPVDGALKHAQLLGVMVAIWPVTVLGTRLTGFAKGAGFLAELPAKFFIYIAVASVLEYYLATSPAPLGDGLLIAADRSLGVDWPAICAWSEAHPGARAVLQFAYFGLLAECGVVVVVTALFYPRRARRFSTALILSSLFTIPLLWVFPVVGPYASSAELGVPQSCFAFAQSWTEHYLGMRNHTLPAIPLDDIRGIVDFPSYHAACAVLLAYFLRGIPVITPIAIVFNLLMLLATPVIGGHYVIDVLAGLGVAAGTIWGVERIERGRPTERLPLWRRAAAAPAPH
ncbi:MAG TPA: phosphatase PAP2 family protein [Stellaceae bacterium]|nr:phosphatase PAP2 family protein [Stellaceae bacterium]